ncbi:hypothetical protein NDU88_000728 [Pleurodeles waltl]|uniref:Uncharacterized protein n=1 Tax=Pleurodeles waltl TaxID=8319 RepID=A0AAV7LYX8_PLEWA|nr:hypothetical protein NDU88_000728 [Pleurodeles waltl]
MSGTLAAGGGEDSGMRQRGQKGHTQMSGRPVPACGQIEWAAVLSYGVGVQCTRAEALARQPVEGVGWTCVASLPPPAPPLAAAQLLCQGIVDPLERRSLQVWNFGVARAPRTGEGGHPACWTLAWETFEACGGAKLWLEGGGLLQASSAGSPL